MLLLNKQVTFVLLFSWFFGMLTNNHMNVIYRGKTSTWILTNPSPPPQKLLWITNFLQSCVPNGLYVSRVGLLCCSITADFTSTLFHSTHIQTAEYKTLNCRRSALNRQLLDCFLAKNYWEGRENLDTQQNRLCMYSHLNLLEGATG